MQIIEHYQSAVQDLKAQIKDLKAFHAQRDGFLASQDALKEKPIKISDRILDSNGGDTGPLIKQLEQLEKDERILLAKLDALEQRITPGEEKLHQQLPSSSTPFHRLYRALYAHTVRAETALLLERVIPDRRDALWSVAEQLALQAIALQELTESLPPDTQSFYSARPLPTDPAGRGEVVLACLEMAQRLVDTADELVVCAAHSPELDVPQFAEPIIPPPPVKPLLTPEDQQELEYARALCQQAGKTLETLTENDRQVLSVSLESFRKQRLTGILPVLDYSAVPTTTKADPQIERSRREGKQ